MMNSTHHLLLAAVMSCACVLSPAGAQTFDCGFLSREVAERMLADAVAEGFPDPSKRILPETRPRRTVLEPAVAGSASCLTTADIFPFEDTNGLLLTNFSTPALIGLMTDAANELLSIHGDNYDFIGYWVNFEPDHQVGTAFYMQLFNDVKGIGDSLYDNRDNFGLASSEIEGYVMMWNINETYWGFGPDQAGDFTALVLAQEFEHRWAMFLPSLKDGRMLQGDNQACGRGAHWNFRVDGQGSGMEIAEWEGQSPAIRAPGDGGTSTLRYNTDTGGVFSYSDLYLMGYVSPMEMDSGNSELRYMNDSCGSPYIGTISTFNSGDIVATAGARLPPSALAQHHFRTAWVMIHQPGAPPTPEELDKTVAILEQHMTDWHFSTLGRGTMNNSLTVECDCNQNGIYDGQDLLDGSSVDANANGILDECECLGDLDGDRQTDVNDLLGLLGQWGPCPDPCGPDCVADFDADCAVTILDLLIMLASWGECNAP